MGDPRPAPRRHRVRRGGGIGCPAPRSREGRGSARGSSFPAPACNPRRDPATEELKTHDFLAPHDRDGRCRAQGRPEPAARLRRGREPAGVRKGPGDFVSAADRKAEEVVRDALLKARPGYSMVLEEGGIIEGTDKSHTWHIDPLDGTSNFLHGVPHFAVSIGLERARASSSPEWCSIRSRTSCSWPSGARAPT